MYFKRKLKIVFSLFLMAVILFPVTSCEKDDGPGKDLPDHLARVEGFVKHHDRLIPGAVVYLKFGATEFPGLSPEAYDITTMADDSTAEYKFKELKAGKYYLFARGYDSAINLEVMGGIPLNITAEDNLRKLDVPVTE